MEGTREKLIAIIEEARREAVGTVGSMNNGFAVWYADKLNEAGVIIPPCKIGDTVWVVNLTSRKIFENKAHGMYIAGSNKYENNVRVEYTNQYGEKSYRKFTWAQFGKTVFLRREEAEAKLLEKRHAES